jgi:hypothetical protein
LVTGTRKSIKENKKWVQTICKALDDLNRHIVSHAFASITFKPSEVVLIHGGCSGVDKFCAGYARDVLGWQEKCYEADWSTYGKAAGPKRNGQMISEENPHIVIAFPFKDIGKTTKESSPGTYDCMKQARESAAQRSDSKLYYILEYPLETVQSTASAASPAKIQKQQKMSTKTSEQTVDVKTKTKGKASKKDDNVKMVKLSAFITQQK